MEIQFYGANCVKIRNKRVSIVVDDHLEKLGLKAILQPNDIAVFTSKNSFSKDSFLIDGPGEYEISEASINGIPARLHTDNEGTNSTIYKIKISDWSVAILGHIYPELNEEQLEKIGVVDVLILPVGGNGYTLDSVGAVQLIKKIEPKVVIPTHFADEKIKFDVLQSPLETFLKEMGVTEPEKYDSLVLKDRDLGDKTRVVVLNRLSSSQ